MDYVPRQGVVCVNICGRHLLIPTRKVSAVCNTALPLSGSAFVVWSAIEKDMSFEKVLNVYSIFSKLDRDAQIKQIEALCKKFHDLGFILPKQTEDLEKEPENSINQHNPPEADDASTGSRAPD